MMKPSKLFLHIGTWKTGSSTLQFNLYKLREELEKEGFFYLCKENKMVVNDGVIRSFTRLEDQYVRESRKKLKKILDEKRKGNRELDFISSAEEFSGNPFDGFKNAPVVAENLYEITKDLDLEIYIIVYLRRQDDFFESLYQQSIRLGKTHSFHEFLENFDASDFNWYELLQAYARVFGKDKIIVRRYHDRYLPEENSLIRDFGRVIGSERVSAYEKTTSKNKGFSRDTLEITRIMNKYFEGKERFQLRKIYDRVNAKLPFEKYSFFSAGERAEFLKKYEDSNAAVAREFLPERESEPLFPPPDYNTAKSDYEGLSTEALVAHFSKALLLVKEQAEKENRKLALGIKQKFLRFRIKEALSGILNRFPGLKNKWRNRPDNEFE